MVTNKPIMNLSVKVLSFISILFLVSLQAFSVEIHIDACSGRKPISPYIYGKNNCLSDNPGRPLTESDWQFLKDAGVRMLRESGGNNSTKYNWLLRLSSHPDWYNNVYAHNWDFEAMSLQENLPGVQGLWAFQLIGKVAATNAYNFNDWGYNRSQWWEGVSNNWAGGGGPLPGGGQKEGDPSLYLMDWSADDTVGILEQWFDPEGLGLDPNYIQYWNMDNEPEIWCGTHDDVCPEQPDVESFMQAYFDVAKKARAIYPDIKLVGPIPCNEWQWYNWDNDRIRDGQDHYVWLEYFIKRIGEEQQASGVRLLDVLDVHFYPSETNPSDIVQLHRVWFDTTYDYPGANGVKRLGQWGWDNSIRQEYIFGRCRRWLDEYLGPGHGVTLGVTEMGINGNNPNVTAVWYASTLGVFADEGVELFTPWSWKIGMWEVLHLFSRYCQPIRILSVSDDEETVSAYASINEEMDSVTLIIVCRSLNQTIDVSVTVENFMPTDRPHETLSLYNLSNIETFCSDQDNALKAGTVSIHEGVMNMSLTPLSVTAVLLSGQVRDNP
jgi:hypothetical protein